MEHKKRNQFNDFDNKDIFNSIDTEEKAYWLGFLYADGSVSKSRYAIELTLQERDCGHIVKFKNFIGLDNKISYRGKQKAYRYCFADKTIHTDLISKGCVPTKSLIVKFPSEEQVPNNQIRHFIRGYFDGDGTLYKDKYERWGCGFIGTKSMIDGILDKVPEISGNKIHDNHGNVLCLRYFFAGEYKMVSFLNYIYKGSTIYLDRKYNKYIEYIAHLKE